MNKLRKVLITLSLLSIFLIIISINNKDNIYIISNEELKEDINITNIPDEYNNYILDYDFNNVSFNATFNDLEYNTLSTYEEDNVKINFNFNLEELKYYLDITYIENNEIKTLNIVTDAIICDDGSIDAYVILDDNNSFYLSEFYNLNESGVAFKFLKRIKLIAKVYLIVTECAEQIKARSNYNYNKQLENEGNGVSLSTYVTNQKEKSFLNHNAGNYKFGFTTMGKVGCEVIAAYDLMISLNKSEYLSQTIYDFEKICIEFSFAFGYLGSNPCEIYRYFLKNNIDYDMFINYSNFKDKLNSLSNCKIIMSTWNNPITSGIHTFYIEKKNGMYYAYNYKSTDEIKESSNIDFYNYQFIVGYII